MILASLDPGAARCALVIVDYDPASPPHAPALALLAPQKIDVGIFHSHPEPIRKVNAAGKEYLSHGWRESTEETEIAAAEAVIAALVGHRVEVLLVEKVERIRATGAAAADSAIATHIMIAESISKHIRVEAARVGIKIVTRQAQSWRADLRRYAKSQGIPLEPITAHSGTALDPALRAHLPGMFADGVPSADLRDAGGLLLAYLLPCPAASTPRPKAAAGEKRQRPKARSAEQQRIAALPACTCPPPPARFRSAPHWLGCPRRGQVASPERAAQEHAARVAAKLASGCACSRGPHRRTCPLYVRRVYATQSGR